MIETDEPFHDDEVTDLFPLLNPGDVVELIYDRPPFLSRRPLAEMPPLHAMTVHSAHGDQVHMLLGNGLASAPWTIEPEFQPGYVWMRDARRRLAVCRLPERLR